VGIRHLAVGIQQLLLGIWHSAFGNQYLAFDIPPFNWQSAFGIRHMDICIGNNIDVEAGINVTVCYRRSVLWATWTWTSSSSDIVIIVFSYSGVQDVSDVMYIHIKASTSSSVG
jgi:hypothetical protein